MIKNYKANEEVFEEVFNKNIFFCNITYNGQISTPDCVNFPF